jgi:hypothetical protein
MASRLYLQYGDLVSVQDGVKNWVGCQRQSIRYLEANGCGILFEESVIGFTWIFARMVQDAVWLARMRHECSPPTLCRVVIGRGKQARVSAKKIQSFTKRIDQP